MEASGIVTTSACTSRLRTLVAVCLAVNSILFSAGQAPPRSAVAPSVALVNGRWFDGRSFDARTVYSVTGRFTSKRPARVDSTLDLQGLWIVPPFGEAHNHNLPREIDRDRETVRRYFEDGVFYVKLQGNLPIGDERRRDLCLNCPDGLDVSAAQGSLTATGGAPIALLENLLLPTGFFPGHTRESLKDLRYFTIDSEDELERKWPRIVALRPDFIKTFLLFSDEFERRRDDPSYFGLKGLDPRLLAKVVARSHAMNLRVTTHVMTDADFRAALNAGADEIAHAVLLGQPLRPEDATAAAKRGVVVATTVSVMANAPQAMRAELQRNLIPNLRLLHQYSVKLAIGSDNPADTSLREFEALQGLGVLDAPALLKTWTETTPRTIFPQRRIGSLAEGYEASFLALEGNPLEDLKSVRRIKIRFKQGFLLEQNARAGN